MINRSLHPTYPNCIIVSKRGARAMSTRRKDTTVNATKHVASLEAISDISELDICSCAPASSLCLLSPQEQERETQAWHNEEDNPLLPIPLALNTLLRTHMQLLLPSCTSLSVLLLHVSQLENIHMTPETEVVRERRRYHPSASVVEQIVTNVRRAVRTEDSMYLDTGKGAAILFPNVDQQGAYTIIERVHNNVNLLQAETIVPPLTHETDIVLGIGSYPEQGRSLEHVLASASRVMYRLTLRPAITAHLWDTMPLAESIMPSYDPFDAETQDDENTQPPFLTLPLPAHKVLPPTQETSPVPFLQLPTTVSKRLKSLLSHSVATKFRCVPVGRDHNRLTLAMADPTDTSAISALHKSTGMSIFPVSCDTDALNALLAEQW